MTVAARRPGIAGRGQAIWAPDSETGLVLWNEARGLALTDTDPVSTFTGLGGMPNFTAAGAARPTYRVTGGKPEVDFDGVGNVMAAAGSVSFKHVLIACKYDAATFADYPGLLTGTVTDAANGCLFGEQDTSKFYYDGSQVGVFHKDGVSYVNANQQAPMNAYGVVSYSFATGWTFVPQLGKDRAVGGRFWNGPMRAALAYDHVLSTPARQSAEAYLAAL